MAWWRSTVDLFFRFEGRIGRGRFWTGLLVLAFVGSALLVFGNGVFAIRGGSGTDIWFVFAALLVGVWMLAALFAKRLHDLDRSGWLFLLYGGGPIILARLGDGIAGSAGTGPDLAATVCYLLALALMGFALFELGGREGTRGANRFGPGSARPGTRARF